MTTTDVQDRLGNVMTSVERQKKDCHDNSVTTIMVKIKSQEIELIIRILSTVGSNMDLGSWNEHT